MDSSKLNQLLELQERLANSPAMRAAEQAARQSQALAADRLLELQERLANSPAMRAAEQAAEQYHRMADQAAQLLESPAMRAAEQAAEQYHRMADQAAQLLESPAMRAAEQAAEQYHRMADQAAQLLESPAMRAAEQAAEQYHRMADQAAQLLESPAMRAAEQYRRMADQAAVLPDFLDHSRLLKQFEQAHQTASKLLAETPQLTPELFGGAWNESVAEAVKRLERTEALAEHLDGANDEDTATVQEAAAPEAQARVRARLCWLHVRRGLAR